MNKRKKIIMAVILLAVLLAGGIAGWLALFHQGKPVVNDYTAGNSSDSDQAEAAEPEEDTGNTAVFSSGVNFFTEDTADEINDAIDDYQLTSMGLVLSMDKGTPMEELGVGDIFYLEGSESSPLGETYIGKITSVSEDGDSMTYTLDDPMIDEVFDVLDLDLSEVLTTENISTIEAAEGVTVSEVDSLDSYFTPLAEASPGYSVTTLAATGSDYTASSLSTFNKSNLLVEIELDLLKAMGLDEPDASDFQEKYSFQEGGRITVYRTTTGSCYHRDNCACVGRSKFEMTLTEAVNEGFDPCYLCNPPLLSDDNGVVNFNPSLTLSGKFGLESIACDLTFDWDILSGEGLENLSLNVTGNYLAEIELKSSFEWEFGGRTTSISFPFDCVKVQGLKEKLVPLLFVGYNFTTYVTSTALEGNAGIRQDTSAMPMTLAVAVYVDGAGKVSLAGTAYFNYRENFRYDATIVSNGEWVMDLNYTTQEPDTELGLAVELSGDVDLHLGASVMVYVYNLNPVDLAIAQVGAEAEGALKISYTTNTENADDMISSHYYMRAYLKLMELNIKIRAKLDFWLWSSDVLNISTNILALDHTLAEWGSKNPTRYNSGQMSYTVVTASDSQNEYYKDANGNLIKESGGYRTTLFDEGFFTICGIDQSYIYLLRNNPEVSGTHDIYRVSLEDGTNKKIAEEVTNCLMIDEKYIYYVTNFDANTVMRLDRSSLKEDIFYGASCAVRYMQKQADGYYLVTEDSDMFSWFFGSDIYYTLLNSSGAVIADYGTSPAVEQLALSSLNSYYEASRIVSSGYLRNTAQSIFWLSRDKSVSVETECVSGWNADQVGIFTTLASEEDAATPYTIVLYQAADGSRIDVTGVQSDQAFFTLCQSSTGSWFFFDQTEDSLILYSMNRDFSNKTVLKTFSLSEIPYNLTDCGMTIMNDTIYFYTIPDNYTSTVLYRYDIV